MPVTWCYQIQDEKQYCSTGFPMGCFTKDAHSQQDACSINVRTIERDYNKNIFLI